MILEADTRHLPESPPPGSTPPRDPPHTAPTRPDDAVGSPVRGALETLHPDDNATVGHCTASREVPRVDPVPPTPDPR